MKHLFSRDKLLTTLAVVCLLGISTSPLTAVWLIKRQADRIVKDALEGLSTSSVANLHVSEGFLDLSILVTGDFGGRSEYLARQREATKLVDVQYAAHRQTLGTERERESFANLIRCRDAYRQSRQAVLDLLKSGNPAQVQALFRSDCVPKFQAYSRALGEVVEDNAREARAGGAAILRLCTVLLILQFVFLGYFFAYGFFVPLITLLERMTRPQFCKA